MSLPRPVYPDSVYMITRRCVGRKFLLKPSKQNNQAWLYCLAVAAQTAGVQVIWSTVLSNHHHTGVYDPDGNISAFCRELHRLIAKHHNASYGRFEYFWSSGRPGRLRLLGPEDILDKLVYSLVNPVKPHLVAKASQWPGVNTVAKELCGNQTIKRPKFYFREDGTMPERIVLTLHKPPGFEELSDQDFRDLVSRRVENAEQEAAAERMKNRQRVLGRAVIKKQHHEQSPDSYAAHFKLNPQVASRNKWRRIEALQRLRSFVLEHRDALLRWRTGERDVVFPFGTNMMRLVHGVNCSPAPG